MACPPFPISRCPSPYGGHPAPAARSEPHAPTDTAGGCLGTAISALAPITDTPRLEAEVLLAEVLGVSRTALLAHPEQRVTTSARARYESLVRRRAAACPLPYLLGRAEFYGLDFEVSPAVLIPRPETETLVELALARRPRRVLDVGTGCGCIAVTLAVHLPAARVYATDISLPALEVAHRNAQRHGVGARVRCVAGDLLTMLARAPALAGAQCLDLVVANPPYVADAEWESLPRSVREYEPSVALAGGADGLAVVRRLLAQAPGVLRPGGVLLVELGASHAEAALGLAHAALPLASISLYRDLAGRQRVLEVQI